MRLMKAVDELVCHPEYHPTVVGLGDEEQCVIQPIGSKYKSERRSYGSGLTRAATACYPPWQGTVEQVHG